MKILNANPGMSQPMTENGLKTFLESEKLNMHIGTVTNSNQPNVHPVWYYYDSKANKLYFETGTESKKLANIRANKLVYFCIDTSVFPYKGVRGTGTARISEDLKFNVPVSEKLMLRYLGSLEHPMAQQLLGYAKSGDQLTVEITPKYFSTWDFSPS